MIKQNKEIIAIVPLMSEYSYPDKENQCFAMYSDYTPLPAIKNNCDINISSIFDAIWNEISKISKENNIKYGKFQIDPLIKFNYFRDFTPFNRIYNHKYYRLKKNRRRNIAFYEKRA